MRELNLLYFEWKLFNFFRDMWIRKPDAYLIIKFVTFAKKFSCFKTR